MTAQKEWIVEGNAWKVGNNINTESITPSRWLHEGPGPMREHIAELLIPEFPKQVKEGDVWFGGTNLGCSSSRNAPLYMKYAGVRAIVCKTAARIFYRNAVNSGLPIFEIGDAVDNFKPGDRVRVDVHKGTITNLTTGQSAQAKPFPKMIMELLDAGSINDYIRAHKDRFPLLQQG
jgi:3-isopropylmalate/(R)-2-methylmalate dehydratase small subunit